MNFTSFDYADFIHFALDITWLNFATDFTVNYTQVDEYSFKLIITPFE